MLSLKTIRRASGTGGTYRSHTLLAAFTVILIFAALSLPPLGSQESATMAARPVSPVRDSLDNGLDILVMRDPSSDSIRAELVFRGGASAQAKENAGIISLIAALMSEADPDAKIVPGMDRFSIALDSAKPDAESGLEASRILLERLLGIADPGFMASTLTRVDRTMLVSSLMSEVSGNPSALFEAAVTKKLFGKYPWRRDHSGQSSVLLSLGDEAILKFMRTWFVPNNALLILTGDIDPDHARSAAREALGTWKRTAEPLKQKLPAFPKPGVTRPTWLVGQDPAIPEGIARIDMRYRGPDPESDPASFRTAPLWAELVRNPSGRFVSALAKGVPGFLSSEPVAVGYVPEAGSSWLHVTAFIKADSAATRTQQYKETARGSEMYAMKVNASYFKPQELKNAVNALIDARLARFESPGSAAAELSDAWILGGFDAWLSYPAALAKLGSKDLASFADKYLVNNLEVIVLRLNPADFARQKKSFAGNGYEEITPDRAFWWQK